MLINLFIYFKAFLYLLFAWWLLGRCLSKRMEVILGIR